MNSFTIATGTSARRPDEWRNREITWEVFVQRLQKVVRTPETMEEWRGMTRTQRGNIKDVGGYIGGPMEVEGDRHKGNIRWRTLICIDIDGGVVRGRNVIPDPEAVRQVLESLGYAYAMHTTHTSTPEWPRLRVVLPLDRPVEPDAYQAITRRLMADIGLDVCDPKTAEHARLMYWPSVPKDAPYEVVAGGDGPVIADDVLATYVDWHDVTEWPGTTEAMRRAAQSRHVTVSPDGRIRTPVEKTGIVGIFCRTWDVDGAIAAFGLPYRSAGRGRYTYTGGSSFGGAVVYGEGQWLYSNHATDPASGQLCNAFDLVRIHLYGARDYGAAPDTPITKMPSYKAMCEMAEGLPEVRKARAEDIARSFADAPDTEEGPKGPERGKTSPQDGTSGWLGDFLGSKGERPSEGGKPDEAPEWMSRLDRKGDRLSPTANNYNLLLANLPVFKGAFQTDTFANRKQVTRALPWDPEDARFPRDFTDTDRSEIMVFFSSNKDYPVNGGKDAMSAALDRQFNASQVHPVREFFKSLPAWDGTERIATLFHRYLGAEDTPLNRAITAKHLTAAVKRIFEPGCKYDQVLVLVGPEGTGKSSIIEHLAMGWYQDSNIEVGDKDAYQNLIGHWLIEMAELADYESKSVASYKNFISSTVDRYRPSYGRETISVYRQCVFFATTNETDFLKGRTGNRRFWVLDCPGSHEGRQRIFDGTLEAELPQIWAEAYHNYRARMSLLIDTAMGEQMRAVQAQHEILLNDETTAVIRDYIWRKKPYGWRLWSLEKKKEWLWNNSRSSEGVFGTEGIRMEVCEYFSVAEISILVFRQYTNPTQGAYGNKNISYILDHMEGVERLGKNMKFGDGLGAQKAYRVVTVDSIE